VGKKVWDFGSGEEKKMAKICDLMVNNPHREREYLNPLNP
jgi:hypothetical protein